MTFSSQAVSPSAYNTYMHAYAHACQIRVPMHTAFSRCLSLSQSVHSGTDLLLMDTPQARMVKFESGIGGVGPLACCACLKAIRAWYLRAHATHYLDDGHCLDMDPKRAKTMVCIH